MGLKPLEQVELTSYFGVLGEVTIHTLSFMADLVLAIPSSQIGCSFCLIPVISSVHESDILKVPLQIVV